MVATVQTHAVVRVPDVVGRPLDRGRLVVENSGLAIDAVLYRESYEDHVIKGGHVIQQWDLVMTRAKKQEALLTAIAESDNDGLKDLYHLFLNSCTTAAFGLIDSVMRYGLKEWRTIFKSVPLFPEAYLWIRGLLRPRGLSRLPTVNEEFNEVG